MEKKKDILIAPSLLAADFANLEVEMKRVNDSGADWLHLDVMDGVFVPNISFGFPVIQSLKRITHLPLDVHLMIVQPERYITQVRDCGAMMMNVHYEACTHLHRTVEEIHQAGMKAGVTLNPSTPVALLEEIISELDMVLLMSVNPGFGGQKFIHHTVDKVRRLRTLIDERKLSTLIEVDGGVNATTGQMLIEAGADVLVAGSALFQAADMRQIIHQLKHG